MVEPLGGGRARELQQNGHAPFNHPVTDLRPAPGSAAGRRLSSTGTSKRLSALQTTQNLCDFVCVCVSACWCDTGAHREWLPRQKWARSLWGLMSSIVAPLCLEIMDAHF